jgi:bla regulator protein blaR1
MRSRMPNAVGFCATFLSLAIGPSYERPVHAQPQPENATAALPTFEVVSIKPYPRGYWPTFSYMRFTPDAFIWRNTVIQDVLVYAYGLRDPKLSNRQRLIPGGEKWMFWDWFDIQARMSDANVAALSKLSPAEQERYKRQLLQSMLAERFQLRVHHVTRDSPAWELVVAKNGPKNMTKAADSEESRPIPSDLNHIRWQAAPVSMLIDLLTDLENAPVLDKTGLTGKYDFKLEFARDSETLLPHGLSLPLMNDSEPRIRDALQDQLGLKLVPIKMPLDEIAIDHIEKPSPN